MQGAASHVITLDDLIVSGQEQTGADSNTQKWVEAAKNGQLPPPT